MKLLKIPTLVIKNPLSVNPTITRYISAKFKILALALVVLLSVFLIGAVFLLNIQHQESINLQQKLQFENTKALELKTGLVVDTTADIIAKDGNIPLSVAKKYAVWIYDSSATYGVDPTLILAVMSIESGFNYKVVSHGNAIGLLQVIHSWHKEKTSQVALFDPKNNISVGTQILKEYSNRSTSDVETLLRYNGSLKKPGNYAIKVLAKKQDYDSIITAAVSNSL